MGDDMFERSVLLAAMAVLATGATALAQSGEREWEPVTEQRLLNPEDGDWMSYRRTYDVFGFSPLEEINAANVADLRPVWAYSMRDGSRWVPTPVVANGLMYVSEGSGRVVAFDVVSGEVAWTHVRRYPDDIGASQAFNRHRGVSLYEDKVFWGTADSYLVALDATTGEQMWEVRTGDYTTGQGHSHPPLVADGKVVIGFNGGDRRSRGEVAAFEAESGDLLWRIYTVPAPGEPGSESWAQSELPPLGGMTWGTFSYDPELGLVYVGTGQPLPWATTLRGPGDALYTNSILAIDIDSGEIEWYFQVVPADNWDMDTPYESMLVDLVIEGETRQALIETSKIGWGVVLDRATGEFIHAFPTAHDNIFTGWTDEGRPIFNPGYPSRPRGRRHGHGLRSLPALSRRPQPEFSQLQPGYRVVLRRYQQHLHGCPFRIGLRSARPLRGDGLVPQTRARLRLHWRIRCVRPDHGRTGLGAPPSGRGRHDRLGVGNRGRYRIRRHGRPLLFRTRCRKLEKSFGGCG